MSDSFKQTDIGLIPDDWEYLKLGNQDKKLLSELRNGCTEEQNNIEGDYLVSRIETISDEKIDLVKTKYVKEISEDKIDKYLIKKGDILFSHINSDPHLGKSAIAYKDYDNLLHGMNLLLFHSNEDILNPEFLNFIFNYYRRIGVFLKIRSRAVNQSSINQGKLKSLEIPVPSLPEQKKIAHVLSKIQQAIKTQEQIIITTQELKKALMQKLFTEGLNGEPQKQTEIGLIPESWEVKPLKDAVSYIDYGLSEAIPKNQDFEGVRNVSTADINREGKLLYYKVRKVQTTDRIIERLKLKDGDVLFNWRNSSELIGKTTIYEEQPETHIFASFILRIRCDEVKYHNYFLAYLMNHYREQGVFIQLSRRAVNQANYNRNEIYVLKIPIPSFDEQVKIANAFRKTDQKIDILNIELNTLKELFNKLLNELMIGQIRVKDIEFNRE